MSDKLSIQIDGDVIRRYVKHQYKKLCDRADSLENMRCLAIQNRLPLESIESAIEELEDKARHWDKLDYTDPDKWSASDLELLRLTITREIDVR